MNWNLEIEPKIHRAATLPSEAYSDEALYRRGLEKVFARSWQFLGDEDLVKTPSSVCPVTLLEGSLDEPLVLSRDGGDEVRLLSNVCTHRGMLVAEHAGHVRHLRCRYHGRRFGLDGTCRHMPEFDDVEGFPAQSDHLRCLDFERWGRLLFGSLGAAAPFDEVFGDVRRRLGWLPLHEFTFDPARSRDYVVRCHWALYVDNFLEGFHIPFVHSGLDQVLDYGEYVSELFPWSNLQLGIDAAGGEGEIFDLPADSPDAGRRVAAYYWWIFPNTMLNFYPWGLSVNVVRPLGVDRTRVSFLSYVWRPELVEHGAGAFLDRVEREDEEVVEAVQRGVRSRLYDRGRYSPRREPGVHHFHRLLARELTSELAP
ncbi:MAG: aromatic ring-hydroxylating dioxygenase subunit alpha [Thermoanaerobaculia bacterium]|nr:aromatic ring-hydroxylating dioxygenase subunit alpha [Thermoanaerobaculia bacterium]